MTEVIQPAGSWAEVVDRYEQLLTARSETPAGGELIAEAVATADTALVEVDRRRPDPFGWPTAAALNCSAAVGCYQEAAGWSVLQLPLAADCHYDRADSAALCAGAARLLDAAHRATLTLARAADHPRSALLLADAAAALLRPLLTRPL